MKLKKFIILISLTLFLTGCSKNQNISFNKNLKQNYNFYEYSVTKIMDSMDISIEQADEIFLTLIDLGLDDKINTIIKTNDNYKLYVKNRYLCIYLLDGNIDKITDLYKNVVYPISPPLTSESIEENTEEMEPEINETIEPIKIIEHRFDNINGEIQLIILFNRPLSDDELGNPLYPNYTYKYYLTTIEGDDYIVDYSHGNALSNVYFNKDFTEYRIADSGNGMRKDRGYSTDPLFTEDNIDSIKIILYKKVNDDRYNHNYEIISEYNFPTNEENPEITN